MWHKFMRLSERTVGHRLQFVLPKHDITWILCLMFPFHHLLLVRGIRQLTIRRTTWTKEWYDRVLL